MKKRIFCPDCDGVGFHSEHFVNNDGTIVTHTTKCETCNGERYITVPMTNADRIRAMSDEELAKTIYGMQKDLCKHFAEAVGYTEPLEFDEDAPDILDWLKQTAEEDT